MNILEINIGDEIIDVKTNKVEKLLDRSSNSFCVTRTALTKAGVDCSNWFTENDFKKMFRIK